jgi:hypothetical protein
MKKLVEDDSPTLSNKEKKNLRKFLVDHELYGQIYKDRLRELKESEKDKS